MDWSGSIVFVGILIWPKRKPLVLGQLGVQEAVDVASWFVWWERREERKGDNVWPFSLAFAIQALMVDYVEKSPQEPFRRVGWEKALAGTYKVNTMHILLKMVRPMAIVVNNSHGKAVVGVVELFNYNSDVALPEAMPLCLGLQLVRDIGCSRINVESDCIELITTGNGGSEILTFYECGVSVPRLICIRSEIKSK